jgi:hypothetical protein
VLSWNGIGGLTYDEPVVADARDESHLSGWFPRGLSYTNAPDNAGTVVSSPGKLVSANPMEFTL